MLGRHLFWLISLICLTSECSSMSSLRRSLVRRQVDAEPCQALQGFDCKCTSYRATCTNDRDLPSPLVVLESAKGRFQSVEIVLTAPRDLHVNDQTFEPIHQLFKVDGQNYEFRVKFEKFTALHLASPSIFNRVFPDSNPNARKHIALEIYNPDVPPQDNNRLFENLNVDSLELYALYPFHGTFQQLFQGANIKYLRLSGGEIRSDFSQPFTGNVARLELAKQATSLSAENFPVYPAHELIINAFYISDFSNEHVPNYDNLAELRVHSTERIPANAFQRFSNLPVLSVSSEKDIDSQAFNGLNQLEKLIIKDTKPSQELLNHLPPVKEFETNVDKLDERTQCQLLEKLANGQLALQAVPNGRECTCVSAYLDKAAGRSACDAQGCDSSSCAAIKNNYDASTREFRSPPAIRRADGSDALRQREPKVYSNAYQVSRQDQDKLSRAIPPQQQQQQHDQDHQHDHQQQQPDIRPSAPSYGDDRHDDYYRHYPTEHREDRPAPPMRDEHQQQQPSPHPHPHVPPQQHHHHEDEDEDEADQQDNRDGVDPHAQDHGAHRPGSSDQNANERLDNDYDQQLAETRTTTPADRDPWNQQQHQQHDHAQQEPKRPSPPQQEETQFPSDYDQPADDQKKGDESHRDDHHHHDQQQPDEPRPQSPNDGRVGDGSSGGKTENDDDENNDGTKDENNDGTNVDEQPNREPNEGGVNPVGPNEEKGAEGDGDGDETTPSTTESSGASKNKMTWIPIIIIVAAIVGILLLGAIYMFVIRPRRKRGAAGGGAGGAAGSSSKGYQQAPTNEQQARA